MLTLAYIAISSFILNFIWENWHARFYVHHLGRKINQKILFIATLGDVVILTLFGLVFQYVDFLRDRIWLVIPLGIAVAIWIERYALSKNRWAYNSRMPIIPFINVGLTPTIQLALLGYIILSVFLQ